MEKVRHRVLQILYLFTILLLSLWIFPLKEGFSKAQDINWKLFIRNHQIPQGDFIIESNGSIWVERKWVEKYLKDKLEKVSSDLISKFTKSSNGKVFIGVSQLQEFLDIIILKQPETGIIDIYSRTRKVHVPRDVTLKRKRKPSSTRSEVFKRYHKYKTKYFEIYYKNKLILPPVKAVVDDYYQRIYNHLKLDVDVTPIKLVIALDRSEYLSLGTPDWSSGLAIPEQRTIYVDEKDPLLIRRVIPHEITHIILHNYLGFDHYTIHWISEGLSIYEEMRIWTGQDKVVITMENYKSLPIEDLILMKPYIFSSKDTIVVYYQQSASLVSFLINEYGMDRFRDFLKALKTRTLENALKEVYGIQSLRELERRWKAFLKRATPTPIR